MQDTPITPASSAAVTPNHEGWWTRDHALVLVLAFATFALLFLCWKMVSPFLSPIAWALALAIVAQPVHGWIARRMEGKPSLAAGLAVAAIALMIVAPAVFVGHQLVKEAKGAVQTVQEMAKDGKWREDLQQKSPKIASAIATVEQNEALSTQAQAMGGDIGKRVTGIVTGSAWVVIELLLTFFLLFFLFRDRKEATASLRSLVPLSERETNEVIGRVSDTVHASIYGTLVVSVVQGSLGGLMFWWLGLPAPILWGGVMALVSIIPVMGAFVVWIPAAIFLAMSGQMGKAMILVAWGALAVGLVDNLLYPSLVGKRLRLHTVPVFLSIIGGLIVFGAAGLVLGPVVLALTLAVIEIWRRRTSRGKAAEEAVATS